MGKWKARLCTALLVLVVAVVLTASMFIKNDEYGISLYQIIIGAIGFMWIGEYIEKFYEWLSK
jgi:hypothetical protein